MTDTEGKHSSNNPRLNRQSANAGKVGAARQASARTTPASTRRAPATRRTPATQTRNSRAQAAHTRTQASSSTRAQSTNPRMRKNPTARSQAAQARYARQSQSARAHMATAGGGVAAAAMRPIMPTQKKSHKLRNALIVILIVLIVLAAGGGFVAYKAYGQVQELTKDASQVVSDVSKIQTSITSSDFDTAYNSATNIKYTAADMQKILSDPIFSLFEMIPSYGQDITNAKVVADVVQDVATDALVPLLSDLQATPISTLVQDKKINMPALNTLLAAVQGAAPAMQTAADRLSALPEFKISKIQTTIAPALTKFNTINELFQSLADLAPIAGTLLGQDGNRQYLIAAQNTAEVRAAGGFPGAVGLLAVTDGAISMGDFGTCYTQFTSDTPSQVAATTQEMELFTDRLAQSRDFSYVPDFERVANVWATSYELQTGNYVNGVISVTPSVVQDLLTVTGPITLSNGVELNGTNATKYLQSDIYWQYASADTYTSYSDDIMDALFAEAADLVFHKAFSDISADKLKQLAKVVFSDIDTREIMFWMTDASEQAQVASLKASGALSDSLTDPVLGVYYSILNPSKLGWYLDQSTTVGEGVKNADGSTTYTVSTTLANTLTTGELNAGSRYIMGEGSTIGYSQGDMRPLINICAPLDCIISNMDYSGEVLESYNEDYNGHQTLALKISLNPGESFTVAYNVTVTSSAEEPLAVQSTPLLTEYR